jgi:hypothetical protein
MAMIRKGLLIRLEAQPGKETSVASFLDRVLARG